MKTHVIRTTAMLVLAANPAAASCDSASRTVAGAFADRFVLSLGSCDATQATSDSAAQLHEAELPASDLAPSARPESVSIFVRAWPAPAQLAQAVAAARPLRRFRERVSTAAFDQLIRGAAFRTNVDPLILHAIIDVESRARPNAVSVKGATGLMQLMPATAATLGVRDPEHALFDPMVNVLAGSTYFRQMHARYRDLRLALAAYNAGPGAVDRHRGVPPYRETRDYVAKVMARYDALRLSGVRA